MKLGEQGSLNSCARFVAWPQTVAKRFDDVIGGYGDVRRIVFDHLRNHVEDAGHGAERRISFLEAANAVKVTKEFVGAVDEMNDHWSEVRSQKSEVRGQRSEVRGRRSEVGGQKSAFNRKS